MSISITSEISSDNATPAIADLMNRTAPEKLAAVIAPPLETFMRVHLKNLGTNKRGWPTTKFWERASRATKATINSDRKSLTIRVDQVGVRQRWKGGTIKPVSARMLAIPMSPVSYGHLPSEFPGAFLLKTKKGAFIAQQGQQLTASGKFTRVTRAGGNASRRLRASLNILFVLKSSVTQAPNPNVVPSDDQFQEVAMAAIQRSLAE
jgi:hypothetical protein